MKRFIPGIAILLILSLTACSAPKTPPKDTGDASNSQSEGIIRLDEGEWPVNEYTEGLPVPTGTVAWAMLDTEHGNFSISIAGIDEKGYDNYMELLIQEGFSVVENVSEKIKGENYVSVGTLLSNGEKGLSISYIPDNLTIYVSLDIPAILLHYNRCVNEGNVPENGQDENYAKARRAFLVGYDRSVPKLRQASHCIGCNQCVSHCPQNIDIPKELHRIDQFVEQLKQGTL